MDKIDRFSRLIDRSEMEEVANQLGLHFIEFENRKLLDIIRIKFLKDGIPEVLESNILTELIEPDPEVENVPDCFGFTDDNNLGCQSCKAYLQCSEALFENIPDCFGELYSEADCSECILGYSCCVPVKFENLEKPPKALEVIFLGEKDILSNVLEALAKIKRIYHNWPEKIFCDPLCRTFNIKWIERRKGQNNFNFCDHLDALYFQVEPGEPAQERKPLKLKIARKPIKL